MTISLIIPTLNGAKDLPALMTRLKNQTVPPDEIIVVDSASTDGTAQLAHELGAKVIEIARKDFDHGGTRDMALRRSRGELVLFMTQDALPADEYYIERLIAPFDDPRVAAVGGRQMPRDDARPFERLVREHNYPKHTRVWDEAAIDEMGVRAFLISDVCSAYRRKAYLNAGGFDHPIMTNEDMLMAQRLLADGHLLCYCGAAAVLHSHNMTLSQQFKRNYIVGRTMKRYEARFSHVSEMGEGTKLAKAVLLALLKEGRPLEALRFSMDCAARLFGNRLGRMQESRVAKKTGID